MEENSKYQNALFVLNNRLSILQDKLLKEAINLDSELKKRVDDSNDILDDYEIELNLEFYLKEDDKEYKEDADNIIATINEYLKGISEDIKKDSSRWEANHNEFRSREEHFMKNEHHCWWYHCLYDHVYLSFENISRIGIVWSDIKVSDIM